MITLLQSCPKHMGRVQFKSPAAPASGFGSDHRQRPILGAAGEKNIAAGDTKKAASDKSFISDALLAKFCIIASGVFFLLAM